MGFHVKYCRHVAFFKFDNCFCFKLRPFAQDIITQCEDMLGIKPESRRPNKSRKDDDEDLKNFKFPEQTFDRSEIDRALDRGYANR